MLVHVLKEIQKVGEAGLLFAVPMLIVSQQILFLCVPNNSIFDSKTMYPCIRKHGS